MPLYCTVEGRGGQSSQSSHGHYLGDQPGQDRRALAGWWCETVRHRNIVSAGFCPLLDLWLASQLQLFLLISASHLHQPDWTGLQPGLNISFISWQSKEYILQLTNLHSNRLLLWMKDVLNKSPKIHHNDHTNQSYVLLCFTGVKIILFWYLIINSKTKPNYSLIYSVVKLNIIRTTELILTRSLLDCRSELTCWLLLYHPFSPFTYI